MYAVTIGLAVPTIVLGAKFSLDSFSRYQQYQASQRVDAAAYRAGTANQGPESCRSIVSDEGLIDWFTCVVQVVTADGGAKQAEYDLKAQQDMAAWAFGMLIVTVWLTVITLLGVLFVWRTLKATQHMARETTRIGEAQASALVFFWGNPSLLLTFDRRPGHETLQVDDGFCLINRGNTPAWQISGNLSVSIQTGNRGHEIACSLNGDEFLDAMSSSKNMKMKETGHENLVEADFNDAAAVSATIEIYADYTNIFGRRFRVRGICDDVGVMINEEGGGDYLCVSVSARSVRQEHEKLSDK